MISNQQIEYCDNNESPLECYKWNDRASINHALVFYTQHSSKLSPVVKHIFPDSFAGYERAGEYLYSLASDKGSENLCAHVRDMGETTFSRCVNEIGLFQEMAQPHFNKSMQPTAEAAAD